MSTLFERYLGFVNSLLNSKKQCLSSLANLVLADEDSLCAQNIQTIKDKSGLDDVLAVSPKVLAQSIIYCEIPVGDEWIIGFLDELLELRRNNLELDFVDLPQLTRKEINELIYFLATS